MPPSSRSPRALRAARKTMPHLSDAPWSGFLGKERKRAKPLDHCPNKRCGRAKACIAAYDGVFCQRTHHAPPKRKRPKPRNGRLNDAGLAALMQRVQFLAEERENRRIHMTARWKSGEFDALFGPYAPRGVLISPPPKVYAGSSHHGKIHSPTKGPS
jgi:hypothetical protein